MDEKRQHRSGCSLIPSPLFGGGKVTGLASCQDEFSVSCLVCLASGTKR